MLEERPLIPSICRLSALELYQYYDDEIVSI